MKRSPVQMKRSSIKRKSKTPEQIQEQKENIEKMWELFNNHWLIKKNLRGFHRCESCGCGIYSENKNLYHHHLLPKGQKRYEHLALEIDNLMMLCESCHTRHENGISTIAIQTRTDQAHKRFNV